METEYTSSLPSTLEELIAMRNPPFSPAKVKEILAERDRRKAAESRKIK
jgi:hypothetical protein